MISLMNNVDNHH